MAEAFKRLKMQLERGKIDGETMRRPALKPIEQFEIGKQVPITTWLLGGQPAIAHLHMAEPRLMTRNRCSTLAYQLVNQAAHLFKEHAAPHALAQWPQSKTCLLQGLNGVCHSSSVLAALPGA